jgi:transcriptional regulator with XRE-family HTH domain
LIGKFGSIGEAAKALGKEPENIYSNYLSGKSLPGAEILLSLMIRGCDLIWLLTGSNPNYIYKGIGKRLKNIREKLGFNHLKFAESINRDIAPILVSNEDFKIKAAKLDADLEARLKKVEKTDYLIEQTSGIKILETFELDTIAKLGKKDYNWLIYGEGIDREDSLNFLNLTKEEINIIIKLRQISKLTPAVESFLDIFINADKQ